MAEIAFDTMAAVRRLRDTGLEERQAEAITATVRDGITGGVATKADIEALQAATRADIDALRIAAKADIEALQAETRAEFNALRAETRTEFNALRAETRTAIEALQAETRTEFNALRAETRTAIAGLKAEIRWIKLIGGAILAAVIAGSGFLYSEIRTNRDNISNLMQGQAEIKAILNERLPRE